MSSLLGSFLLGGQLLGGAQTVEPEIVQFSIDEKTFTTATWIDERTIALGAYALTKTKVKIKDIVKGDGKIIRRHYTSLPTGATVSSAELLIKRSRNNTDAAALVALEITASASVAGQVTDATTTSDGDLDMDFVLSPANTALAALKPGTKYPYFIRLTLTDTIPHTMEVGEMEFLKV